MPLAPQPGDRPGALVSSPPASLAESTFTRDGLLRGARLTAPLAVAGLPVAFLFGTLARQTGLDPLQAPLMSALVFAGAAQFVALDLWREPPPLAALVVAVLAVNARYLLMGATLAPWLAQLSPARSCLVLFFLSDETWALAEADRAAGRRDATVILGSGLALFLSWVGGTVAGHRLGGLVAEPARWGLDFAFVALFAALLADRWDGRHRILPWSVAAAVAVAAERWLPAGWHILLGALAGALTAAATDRDA